MNKIKILRITSSLNAGAIGKTAEQLGQLVLKEGWESYYAYSRYGNPSSSQTIKVGGRLSIWFHVLITRLFDLYGYGSYYATKKLVKEIVQISPDLIHLHNIHSYDFNLNVLFEYLKKGDTPVVWTQHDCWAYTGHCPFYSMVGCNKWKTGCHDCPQSHEYPKSWFFDGSRRNFRHKKKIFCSLQNVHIVAVSGWIKNELTNSFLSKYPLKQIYNGIDTNIFRPYQDRVYAVKRKYGFGDKKLLIGVAAIWEPRKGIDDYIKLNEIITDDYQIVLVGVSEKIRKHIPEKIKVIDRTENMEELALLYSVSDISLNLSYEESFGKTTAEALACGIPCIVYDCTASPELVDEKTGVVVKPGDVLGVWNAIKEISSWDLEKTRELCRERACNLFSKDKNYKQYIDLYKEILKIS